VSKKESRLLKLHWVSIHPNSKDFFGVVIPSKTQAKTSLITKESGGALIKYCKTDKYASLYPRYALSVMEGYVSGATGASSRNALLMPAASCSWQMLNDRQLVGFNNEPSYECYL